MPRELLLVGPRNVVLSAYDEPPLAATSVRLRTLFSGISHGTEMLLYRGRAPKFAHQWDGQKRQFDLGQGGVNGEKLPLGYESVARVEAVGPDAEGLAPGDLVWVDAPHRETHVIDLRRPQPYRRFDGGCDPTALTFFALCRVALGAVHDAEPVLGSSAVVCGLGVVGQLCVQLLRRSGVRTIFGIDRDPVRLATARRAGAISIWTEGGDPSSDVKAEFGAVDFAIEASGDYAGLSTAIRCVAPMGRVVVVSSYGNQADGLVLGHEFHRNRITLVSSMTVNGCPSPRAPLWSLERLNQEAAALLSEGSLDTTGLITGILPFSQAADAYRAIDDANTAPLKVIFSYDGE
jgi:threonine dehydrogenase-like Zn-dependent dehydrogenase